MNNRDNWYQLPPDINTWQNIIIANLARKVPSIPQYITGMDLPKIDPVAGDADGLIVLQNGLAAVPITVRNSKLAPLDVMVTNNDEFYPVTDAFLQKINATNTIGTPATPPGVLDADIDKEGPARKIVRLNTIDQFKYASVNARKALREKIASSNEVQTFFRTYRPSLLEALKPEYDNLSTKVASAAITSQDTPVRFNQPNQPIGVVKFLVKEASGYYYNGKHVHPTVVGSVLKEAKLSYQDGATKVLNGEPICIDSRDIHPTLIPPTLDKAREDSLLKSGHSFIATVFTRGGTPHRGLLFKVRVGSTARYLFVGPDFYSYQDDVAIADLVKLTSEDIRTSLVPEKPSFNSFGVMIGPCGVRGPLRVTSALQIGPTMAITTSNSGITEEYDVGPDGEFFSIPDRRVGLVTNMDEIKYNAPGSTFTVRQTLDGSLVLEDEVLSYNNALYKLMVDKGLSFDDALTVGNAVKTAGITLFKIAATDNTAAESNSKSKPKSDNASPPAGPSDPQSGGAKGQAGQSTATSSSSDPNDPNAEVQPQYQQMAPVDMPVDPAMFGMGTGQQGQQAQQSQMDPVQMAQAQQAQIDQSQVNFDDIQDIAKINDPTLMDSYLSGSLARANMAGKEELMQISDNVIQAIKSIGKLLFRVRLGQVDYVKEADLQTALNKMSDICNAIGLSSSQVNMSTAGNFSGGYPSIGYNQRPTSNYSY